MPTAFYNGTIYSGNQVFTGKVIVTDHGIITGIVDLGDIPGNSQMHDLRGRCIAPACIDLQIYGGNGKLFSHEPSKTSLEATNAYCRAGGASRFMITMATNSMDKMLMGIEVVEDYWATGGKGLLGLHLEGPYINPVKKGAHIPHYIRQPEPKEVQYLLERGSGVIKMVTLAPECCSPAIIGMFLENGIIVSAGHSDASYQQVTQAFNAGIPAATHLFNAMSPFQSREPGMVGAVYDHPEVKSSIICDGIHVDYASVRISKKIMGERLFFITDAVTPTAEGEYQHVFKGDHYTLPGGTLSGSALTMMKSIQNAIRFTGIGLEECLRMASLYPVGLLGPGCNLGRIEKGYQASFIVFDEQLEDWQLIDE